MQRDLVLLKKQGPFRSEEGNISAVLMIIMGIGAAIAYFMGATDLVDKEIRGLGATQQLSFQKAELETSMRKWLQGNANTGCGVPNLLKTVYTNFALSGEDSKITFTQPQGTLIKMSTAGVNFNTSITSSAVSGSYKTISCFLNPNRYQYFSIKNFVAEFSRLGTPNYQGLTNEVGVKLSFEFHYQPDKTSAKIFRQKLNFRYRLEAAALSNYTLVLTEAPSDRIFQADSPDETKVYVAGKTLVVGDPPELNKLSWFGPPHNVLAPGYDLEDEPTVAFQREVHLSSPSIVVDNPALPFVKKFGLAPIFQRGLITEAVPSEAANPGYSQPTSYTIDRAWSESFNYYFHNTVGSLPFTSSSKSANVPDSSDPSGVPYYSDKYISTLNWNDNRLINTDAIFTSMNGDGNKVYTSCHPTANKHSLLVWGNLNTDYIIDFSDSNSAATPPQFCGMIAAKRIIVKLNNLTDQTKDLSHHYLIGRFIVKEGITIIGRGKLHLIDALNFQPEDTHFTGVPDLSPSAISTHIYSLSYTIYRNFFLPILRPNVKYSDLPVSQYWIKPISVTDFVFTAGCGSYMCYSTPPVPVSVLNGAGENTYPLIDQAMPNMFFMARSVL